MLAYRSKKKREAMVESAKNTLKRVISWESDTTENPQIIPVVREVTTIFNLFNIYLIVRILIFYFEYLNRTLRTLRACSRRRALT